MEPKEIAAKAAESTVVIVVYDVNGQPLQRGSGFFVDHDMVVTNYHVIDGGHSASVRLCGVSDIGDVVGVLGNDVERDIAMLRIEGITAPALTLQPNRVPVGERVYAFGAPLGLEGTISDGLANGIRIMNGFEWLQISAAISSGSSGGPVFDSNGTILGVATQSLVRGQSLNFAVPADEVSKILAASRTKKSSPLIDLSRTHTYSLDKAEGRERLLELIERMPEMRRELYQKFQSQLGGSTAEMRDGLYGVADGLKHHAILLRAIFEGRPYPDVLENFGIEMNGIVQYGQYEAHQGGWGGTIASLDSGTRYLRFIEGMIQFHVWNLLENIHVEPGIGHDWYNRWEEAYRD